MQLLRANEEQQKRLLGTAHAHGVFLPGGSTQRIPVLQHAGGTTDGEYTISGFNEPQETDQEKMKRILESPYGTFSFLNSVPDLASNKTCWVE